MTYNRSEIFKAAHILRRKGHTMASALKLAWKRAKDAQKPKTAFEIVQDLCEAYEKENYTEFQVREWKNYGKHRIYITAPNQSKKYQNVGHLDLEKNTYHCAVHATRTNRGREYEAFLRDALTRINK